MNEIRIKFSDKIYSNTVDYFVKHLMVGIKTHKQWATMYHEWLASQGAKVGSPHGNLVRKRNVLNVAPGYDDLVFQSDQDATLFALRWA